MEELSHQQNYRFALIETINQLIKTRIDTGVKIVNLAMAGEFAEINDIFDIGDEIPADVEYFKNCKDTNVQELLKMYQTTEDLISYFMNVNDISESELEVEVEE